MELKPGYKQTEVGVIPEDWEVTPLSELFTFQNGVNADRSAYGAGIPFINVLEVITHHTITEERIPGKVALSAQAISTFTVQHGDVLFNRTSETQGDVGLSSVYAGNEAVVFGGFVIRASPRHGWMSASFMSYALRSPSIRSQIVSRGQGAVRANIGQKDLSTVRVILPTKAEQEAIAEALSDADALIESLEQLLAKKRQIKQGAMQELLTGKRRLPGFSEEWETRRLGDVAEILMGQSPSSRYYNRNGQGLPLIQGNADVQNRQTIKRIFTTEITKQGRRGDLLLSVRAPVGEVSRAVFDVCLGRGVCAIRYPNDFLYHLLIAKESAWVALSKGSTFDSVNSTDVAAFVVELPISVAEQTAIAAILSDMDTELAALESKCAKARAVKQGMMQALLTGAIRLPVGAAELATA